MAANLAVRVGVRVHELEQSCIMIASPSMPVTSEIFIILREPSARRATWTMILMAEATCWRIARCGIEKPDSSIIISRLSQALA